MAERSGWQKGCLFVGVGCLSVVILLITAAGLAFVWAAASARRLGDPTPERISETIVRSTQPAESGRRPTDRSAEDGAEPPGEAEASDPDIAIRQSSDLLHLTLDMQEGSFDVRPGPPGSDVRVEGRYATAYYELTQDESESASSGERRVVVRFRSKRSLLVRALAGLMTSSARTNRLTVTIPEGWPVDLRLRFGQGASDVDLGGLTLTNLRADLSMGDHELEFSRPLAAELPSARLDGQMGDIRFLDLGNARVEDLEVSTSMGDAQIDLGGEWSHDTVSEVEIRHSMGDLRLRIPRDVRLSPDSSTETTMAESRGLNMDTRDETDDPDAPTVELHLTASMGDVRVIRY